MTNMEDIVAKSISIILIKCDEPTHREVFDKDIIHEFRCIEKLSRYDSRTKISNHSDEIKFCILIHREPIQSAPVLGFVGIGTNVLYSSYFLPQK